MICLGLFYLDVVAGCHGDVVLPRVLLIARSATIRHIGSHFLIKAGYEIEMARDCTAALKRFAAVEGAANSFHAVVLGSLDPGIPGATKLLSMLETPGYASLPVLTLAHDPDKQLSAWVGRRAHTAFLLWADYQQSSETLERLLSETLPDRSEHASTQPLVQPIRVLFVDDSRTVRVKYRRLLTANGYQAKTACSVSEGLEKAIEAEYDIAIIDYFMPDGTGDQLCRRLRDNNATSNITTAIITATYHDSAIQQSLEAGAVECMFKNESDDLFLARIDAMSRHIRAHKLILNDRKRLGGILRSVGDGVYGVDSTGRISFVNPACLRILGYDPQAQMIGKLAHQLFHYADVEGNSINETFCQLQQAYQGGEQIDAGETVFWHKSGTPIPIEFTVYPLNIEEKREGSVVAFRDVSERKLLEQELRWQASHDALTKLSNRRYFEELLSQEVDRLSHSCEKSALLYLDLDRFKYINDTAGHAAGDRLLVEISQQMTQRLRKSDLLARLGGDEFAIILRNISKESVHVAADAYRKMLDTYLFVYNGKQYKVNGTIGIALIDCDSESASEVLANADIACHLAKGEGRNRSHLFVPENDNKKAMDLDLGWSSRLHNALLNDTLMLHFQPIIPVKHIPKRLMSDNKASIYKQLRSTVPSELLISEVLLRLSDPVWSVVYPGTFLPTAERFNMMDKIDYWVIKAALTQLSNLQRTGYKGMLTINLSGQTIANKAMIKEIESLVVDSKVDPVKVIFEITETSAVSNLISANELITRLNSLGCRFALDDFGSGFSSFSHLKNLPVDFIKIDGLFVKGVANDPSDRAIIQSINDIAHSLGKQTIAEYVENAQILQVLSEMGVDFVQGYFLSPPLDVTSSFPQPFSHSPQSQTR